MVHSYSQSLLLFSTPTTAIAFSSLIIMHTMLWPWPCPQEPNVSNQSHKESTKNSTTLKKTLTQNHKSLNTWSCLQETTTSSNPQKKKKKKTPQPIQKQAMTFAQALTNLCEIPSLQLPQPTLKRGSFTITILEDEYLAWIEACKHNLHSRIIWLKGATPLLFLLYALN